MDQTVIYITMNYLAAICNLCAHRPQHHPHHPHYIVIALDVMSHLFHIFRNKHSEVKTLLIEKTRWASQLHFTKCDSLRVRCVSWCQELPETLQL
jgi:hypothetical protein